jgi:hypothetical protein
MDHRKILMTSAVAALILSPGCERREVRQGRQVMVLVHRMGLDLRTVCEKSMETFEARLDFEDIRKGFGEERFDGGVPPGADFRRTLETMSKDLEDQLEREPKTLEFPRTALRRIRRFGQWWSFVRQTLKLRRAQLAGTPPPAGDATLVPDVHSRRGDILEARRGDTLEVLDETIKVVDEFEKATARCSHGIEEIITRS